MPDSVMKVSQQIVMLVGGQQPVRPSGGWTPGLQCLGCPEHCWGFGGLMAIELDILL